MATGPEMAMQMAFKMFGIDTAETREQIITAARSVLSFDARLKSIEENQVLILNALSNLVQHLSTQRSIEDGQRDEQSEDGKIQ